MDMKAARRRRDNRVRARAARAAGLILPARLRPKPAKSANELICLACQPRQSCPIWKALSPCNKRKALIGDKRYPCPDGKF